MVRGVAVASPELPQRLVAGVAAREIAQWTAADPVLVGHRKHLAELRAAGITQPAPLLRSLAAAGQVSRSDAGTWDTAPSPDTRFALTAAGTGLAHTLGEIEDWGRRNLPTIARDRRQRGRMAHDT